MLPEKKRTVRHHSVRSLQDWEGGSLGGGYTSVLDITTVFTSRMKKELTMFLGLFVGLGYDKYDMSVKNP